MGDTQVAYHVPVLLAQSIEGMNIHPGGTYVDVTFGGGGHSREILRRIGEEGHLYGFDQDEDAMRNAPADKRFTFVRSNFRYLKNFMRYYGVKSVDGVLADLGVSSHLFDDGERGFSFRYDAPLDMRMNRQAAVTAADIVNGMREERLADTLRVYGELRDSRRIAAAIVKARALRRIATTGDLVEAVKPLMGRDREKKDLAKVFQALRIEVNQEMAALGEMLQAAISLLRPGGRLVVITYHSLEDRMVKNVMRSGNAEGKVEQDFYGNFIAPLTTVGGKVITPDNEEQQRNPRSRSAKLRIAEKR